MAKSQALSKAEKKRADKKKKEKARGKSAWKLFGSTSALVAGLAAARALDVTWRTATGHRPPTRPESPEIAGREAILWAALSGMAIGVAKTYATRRAANYWVKSTGQLPPGMKEKASPKEAKRIKQQAASR